MQLPNDEIGISDILQWIDCPARMVFGLRRRTGKEAPESWSPENAFGSAIHMCIKAVNEGATEDEAVQAAIARYPQFLEPSDMQQLYDDLATYEERDEIGVRTVMSEQDCRVPLFKYEGRWIYFRFTIDRLYQRLDNEAKFILVDYKSGKWLKSKEEVDEDKQLSAYDFGVHEFIPECEDLIMNYDQLRGGMISTKRTPEQRRAFKAWLINMVTAILEDDTLEPRFNDWCPWCPLKMDCPVVRDELTDWATARIAALAPREPKRKKDGSESKVLDKPKLDPERFEEYVSVLPAVKRARQVLEAFDEAVTDAMKRMPEERLHRLKRDRHRRYRRGFTPVGLRQVHDMLGAEFYHVASLSQAEIDRFYGKSDERALAVKELLVEQGGYDVVVPAKEIPQAAGS